MDVGTWRSFGLHSKPMSPESRTFTSQRLQLHFLVWGDESNPPLLLIHGTRDHAWSWRRTAEALADRYCVYAPDLRGHGDSGWATGGEYSIIDYALDLHALGEAIGRAPYTIVAHSLGGGVALQYAGAFPGVYETLEAAEERMREANGHLTPELARELTEHGVRRVEGGFAWKYDNFTRSGSPYEFNMEDARDLWNQVRCPILILFGEESFGRRMGNVDLSAFHDYRSVRVEKAGHWVHHDQFEVFMSHVDRFLAE